jgi:hypothetical protein
MIFFVIMAYGNMNFERRTGRNAIAAWSAIASTVTFTLAIILRLIEGLVGTATVIGFFLLFVLCSMWYLFTGID